MVRNRTSHDAFVHILSAHFCIILMVSCVYHFRHTSAKAPIQMTNDYIAKQESSRCLCIVSSPLSGKSATVDLNHDSLCIVGFYTTHYPLCYRRKYGLHTCICVLIRTVTILLRPATLDTGNYRNETIKPTEPCDGPLISFPLVGERRFMSKQNMNKPYTPNCRCCIPIRSRLERIYIAPLCDSHSLSRLRVQGIW